jgi:hypothetical protein
VRLGAIVWGAPSIANGLLFVPVNSVLKVFNAKTLDLLTSLDTGGTIAAGAAAVVNGNVIVSSGLMYTFATDALPNNKIICYSLDGGSGTTPPPPTGAQPTGAATWSAVYSEVIVANGCTGSSMCHGGDVGVGALSLQTKDSAYTALVGTKAMGSNLTPGGTNCKDLEVARVVAGDPDNSLLVEKLEATQPCGDPMPPGGIRLKDAQIQQVRMWVKNGAKRD